MGYRTVPQGLEKREGCEARRNPGVTPLPVKPVTCALWDQLRDLGVLGSNPP